MKNAGLTAEDAPELYLPYDSTRAPVRFGGGAQRGETRAGCPFDGGMLGLVLGAAAATLDPSATLRHD